MAITTLKNAEIDRLLSDLSGTNRPAMIAANLCAWCKQPATEFTDELSKVEYTISGLCQKCQDETFFTDDDDEEDD
jgi:hypothetical protein